MRKTQRNRIVRGFLVAAAVCMTLVGAAFAKEDTSPTPTEEPKVYGPVYYSGEGRQAPASHTDVLTGEGGEQISNEILFAGAQSAGGVQIFRPGTGREESVANSEMMAALGWPDYDPETGEGALELGHGGVVVLEFGWFIREAAGPDLYIFTTGANSDDMKVELSADGNKYYEVSLQSKTFNGVDGLANIPAESKPRYIRITDRTKKGKSVAIDSVVIFNPEPLQKPVKTDADKEPWYEKAGLSKKTVVIAGIVIGVVVLVWAGLNLVRWNNKRRRRKLRLVKLRKDRQAARGQRSDDTDV